jgi:hypothetical protein
MEFYGQDCFICLRQLSLKRTEFYVSLRFGPAPFFVTQVADPDVLITNNYFARIVCHILPDFQDDLVVTYPHIL